LAVISLAGEPERPDNGCQPVTFDGAKFTVCQYAASEDIRLFWGDGGEEPFGHFERLDNHLEEGGKDLIMAMNGGMYHADRTPVGYYLENGNKLQNLQTKASDGNFGLLPNGVFFIQGDIIGVEETGRFASKSLVVENATQSGPMLVIEGALHPKFNRESESRKRRNGVGVSADGQQVYFAISEELVNFHHFARLFKDHLKTPNALYLDGTISRLYDAEHQRSDLGLRMGPIVGVVRDKAK